MALANKSSPSEDVFHFRTELVYYKITKMNEVKLLDWNVVIVTVRKIGYVLGYSACPLVWTSTFIFQQRGVLRST